MHCYPSTTLLPQCRFPHTSICLELRNYYYKLQELWNWHLFQRKILGFGFRFNWNSRSRIKKDKWRCFLHLSFFCGNFNYLSFFCFLLRTCLALFIYLFPINTSWHMQDQDSPLKSTNNQLKALELIHSFTWRRTSVIPLPLSIAITWHNWYFRAEGALTQWVLPSNTVISRPTFLIKVSTRWWWLMFSWIDPVWRLVGRCTRTTPLFPHPTSTDNKFIDSNRIDRHDWTGCRQDSHRLVA